MTQHILLTDRDCRVVWCSGKINNDTIPDLIGERIWDFATSEYRESMISLYSRCSTLGETGSITAELLSSNLPSPELWRLDIFSVATDGVSLCTIARQIDSRINLFTDREQSILRLVGAGRARREIAKELDIASSSVDSFMAKLRAKIGVRYQPQLIIWASRNANGLL